MSAAKVFIKARNTGRFCFELRPAEGTDERRLSLLGGKQEEGETIEECARREIREESDYEINELTKLGSVKRLKRLSNSETSVEMETFFFFTTVEREDELQPRNEVEIIEWHYLDEVTAPLSPSLSKFIEQNKELIHKL